MTYRASIAERIAWTTALRGVDAKVLQALSTFGDFQTGKDCRPKVSTLTARAFGDARGKERKRTVERSLQRLERERYIIARRRHRHATTYDICLERLATNYVGAKVVSDSTRDDRESVRQSGGQPALDLSATSVDQSAKNGNFDRQIGGPIPSTYPELDPSAPALRAGGRENDAAAAGAHNDAPRTTAGESPEARTDGSTTLRTRTADVKTDDRDHPDDAAARASGPRGNQVPTLGVGVQLPERPGAPGAPGAERSGAPVEPQQQEFLLDVSARRPQHSNFERLAAIGLKVLRDVDAKKKNSA